MQEYGEFLWELGKRDQALTVLQRALDLSPENQYLLEFVERIKQDY
ncbi:tetratricopeptide repeat protein [Terrilactibacillus sp. S3-3]|nr:tetratricopeptide repeat protein [Terrilactibacillus sp. S3-3]